MLKLFLPRRPPWRSAFGGISHRAFEGKRGISPAARHETERVSLALWAQEGFDVPRLLEGARPEWAEPAPFLWLEYAPGRRLRDVLVDTSEPQAEREALARRLGAADGRRHRRALELNQPLLLHEHPTTKHVLLSGDRLVTIDLENGYRAGYCVMSAITRELAGVLRSLQEGAPPPFDQGIPRAYLEGYGDRALLERAADLARSRTPGWLAWRLSDQLRRREHSKAAVMQRLADALAGAGLSLE